MILKIILINPVNKNKTVKPILYPVEILLFENRYIKIVDNKILKSTIK